MENLVPNTIEFLLEEELRGGSLVLLDSGSADALACNQGALPLLLRLGAVSVGDLLCEDIDQVISSALALSRGSISASEMQRNKLSSVVIFVSTLLEDAQELIFKVCHAAGGFTERICLAFGVSEAAHYEENESRYSDHCYSDFVTNLYSHCWHGQTPGTFPSVRAIHVPLALIPVGPAAFVLPGGSAASLATLRGNYLGIGSSRRIIDGGSMDPGFKGGIGTEDGSPRPSSRGDGTEERGTKGLVSLAHDLAFVAAALSVDPEVFCLGTASSAVGQAWSFVPPVSLPGNTNSTNSNHAAAFVLVDRDKDMVSPCLHKDLLVSKIWEISRESISAGGNMMALGRQENCITQTLVPMSLFGHLRTNRSEDNRTEEISERIANSQSEGNSYWLSASVFHPSDPIASSHLGFLLTRKGRDAAMFIRKWLRELARREGTQPHGRHPKSRDVSPEELEGYASALSTVKRASSLCQLASIAAKSLRNPFADHWELISRTERTLMSACCEGSEILFEQLCDIISSSSKMGVVRCHEIVTLILVIYCYLAECMPWYSGDMKDFKPFSAKQREKLIDLFVDAIFQRAKAHLSQKDDFPSASQLNIEIEWLPLKLQRRLVHVLSSEGDHPTSAEYKAESNEDTIQELKLQIAGAILDLFHKMEAISQSHRQAAFSQNMQEMPQQHDAPRLLAKIAGAAVEDKDIPGLVPASTSITGLLRSGLGSLGLQQQVRLGKYQTVVIFVIGGLSLSEMHEALTIADEKITALQMVGACADVDSVNTNVGNRKSIAPAKSPQRIIIGGSCLLQPNDVVKRLMP